MPARRFEHGKTVFPVILPSSDTRKPKAGGQSCRNDLTLPPLRSSSRRVDPRKSYRNSKTTSLSRDLLQQGRMQAALRKLRQSKAEFAASELDRSVTPQQRECMLLIAAQESVNSRLTRALRSWADHNYCQLEEDPVNLPSSVTSQWEDTGHYPSGFGFFLCPEGAYSRDGEPILHMVYDVIMSLDDKDTQDRLLCFLNDFVIRRSLYRWTCSKTTRAGLLVDVANWFGQILKSPELDVVDINFLDAGEGLRQCYMKTYDKMMMLKFIRKMMVNVVEYLLMTPEETKRLQEVMGDGDVLQMTLDADPSPTTDCRSALSMIHRIIKMTTTEDKKLLLDCMEVTLFCLSKGMDDTAAAIVRTENAIHAKKDAITKFQGEAQLLAEAMGGYRTKEDSLEEDLSTLNLLAASVPSKDKADKAVQTMSKENKPTTPQSSPKKTSTKLAKVGSSKAKGRSKKLPKGSQAQRSTAAKKIDENENAKRTAERKESTDKTKAQNLGKIAEVSTAPDESPAERIPARVKSCPEVSSLLSVIADANMERDEPLSSTSGTAQSSSSEQNTEESTRRFEVNSDQEKRLEKETPVRRDRKKSEQPGQRRQSRKISRKIGRLVDQKTSRDSVNHDDVAEEEVDDQTMEMLQTLVENLSIHTHVLEECLKRMRQIAQRELTELADKQDKITGLFMSLRSALAAIDKQKATLPSLVFKTERVSFTNRASAGHKCRFCSCHLVQEVIVDTLQAAAAVGKTLSHCGCFSNLLADMRSSYEHLCKRLSEVEALVTTSAQVLLLLQNQQGNSSLDDDRPDIIDDDLDSLPLPQRPSGRPRSKKTTSDLAVVHFSSAKEGLGKAKDVASFVQTLTGYVLEAQAEASARLQKLQEQRVLVDQVELVLDSAQQPFQVTAKQVAETRCRNDFLLVGKILRNCYCHYCQCYLSPFLEGEGPFPAKHSRQPRPLPDRPQKVLWPALVRATASVKQGLDAVHLRWSPSKEEETQGEPGGGAVDQGESVGQGQSGGQGLGAGQGRDLGPAVSVVSALDPLALADIDRVESILAHVLQEAAAAHAPRSVSSKTSASQSRRRESKD